MITKENLAGKTAAQVGRLLAESRERRIAAAASANAAIDSYGAAVRERDTKIQDMTEDLNKQLEDIAAKAEALKPDMLKATIAGDSAGLSKAKRTLDSLEGRRTELAAQLELLSGKPPRCDEAYAAMEAAVAKSAEEDGQYEKDAQVILEFCEEAMKPWEEVITSLRDRGEEIRQYSLNRARSQYSSEQ